MEAAMSFESPRIRIPEKKMAPDLSLSSNEWEAMRVIKLAMDTLDKNLAVKKQARSAASRIRDLSELKISIAGQK
jgi:hypothetical protein